MQAAPTDVRLFVAIDPSDEVRAALDSLPETLRGVSWTPPGQHHLTLEIHLELHGAGGDLGPVLGLESEGGASLGG